MPRSVFPRRCARRGERLSATVTSALTASSTLRNNAPLGVNTSPRRRQINYQKRGCAMSAPTAPYSLFSRDNLFRLARAGVLTGVADGLFSSVLSVAFYHSTAQRLFQGVAATLLGAEAFNGGDRTFAIGVLMHFGVAFGWSTVFLFVVQRAPWIRRLLNSPYGAVKVASLYGPFIWVTMSMVVIPVLMHRPPAINIRWLIQLIGHIPFVGIPIVASIGRSSTRFSPRH